LETVKKPPGGMRSSFGITTGCVKKNPPKSIWSDCMGSFSMPEVSDSICLIPNLDEAAISKANIAGDAHTFQNNKWFA
jgi:hypothetical protein